MARLFQRHPGGNWYADFRHPITGSRCKPSLGTTDKTVARQRAREAELAASSSTPRRRRQRLSEAIDYVVSTMIDRAEPTREMYREKGRRIFLTFGDPWIDEIDRDAVTTYIARRLSDDAEHGRAAPHTVSKELIVMRRALREAHDRGLIAAMPAWPRFSPKYKPREVWLTPDHFERVAAELAPHRDLWAACAALGGGSAGEVERIDRSEIELVGEGAQLSGWMRIPGTKRETRDRRVPMAPALAWRIKRALDEGGTTGRLVQPWSNVRRDLRAAVDAANLRAAALAAAHHRQAPPMIPYVSPNDLRRTFASWLVQAGVPLFTVAALMGHSSTRMVERVYGKLSRQNLESAIAVLPRFPITAAERNTFGGVPHGVPKQVALPAIPEHSRDGSTDPD